MAVDGRDARLLYEGLLSAFPDENALERMVAFGLGIRLAEIASGNLSDKVFAVVRFADAHGRLDELVEAALRANPGNAQLRAAAEARAAAREGEAARTAAPAVVDKRAVRRVLEAHYSLEELQLLCAELEGRLRSGGYDVRLSLDDLAGTTRAGKALSLVEYLDRRRALSALADIVREQRPGVL